MRDSPGSQTQALEDGARRSREASSPPTGETLPRRLWRRHKWKLITLALFALFDLVFLGGFFRGHF